MSPQGGGVLVGAMPELKRLIVIAVVSFASQFAGWILGAQIVVGPVRERAALNEQAIDGLTERLELYRTTPNPVVLEMVRGLKETVIEMKADVSWIRNNMNK